LRIIQICSRDHNEVIRLRKEKNIKSRLPASSSAARAADLLARMTLEEKIGQLSAQIQMPRQNVIRRSEVGSIRCPAHFLHLDGARPPSACAEAVNAEQRLAVEGSRLGIPVLIQEEGLHGACWGDATCFPQAIALAATWDPDLMGRVAGVIATELRAVGCRQVLSPVLNLARDPRWGRMEECYGEDPHLVACMGVAFVHACEQAGVATALKHFVANYGDGGRDSNAVNPSERQLRERELLPFAAAVREGGARGIMAAYNSLDGTPCHCNHWLLTELLRDEWGFTGIVVGDYGGVGGVSWSHHTVADQASAAAACLSAGLEVELPEGGASLAEAHRRGLVAAADLDRAVLRMLTLKFELGLFESPYVDPAQADVLVRQSDSIELARETAAEACCLLVNRNALPLPGQGRIALLGTAADALCLGGYSGSCGNRWTGPGVTIAAGLGKLLGERLRRPFTDETPADTVRGCAAAVVVVTLQEGEGFDRSRLELSRGELRNPHADYAHAIILGHKDRLPGLELGDQEGLIRSVAATGIPTVVVLQTGSPVLMPWLDQVAAVLQVWYPGEQGGVAVAEVLLGRRNPAGRLPFTWPRHPGQLPLNYDARPSGRGYAYIDDDGKPLFPFGHGLSYTRFNYGAVELSAVSIPPDGRVTVRVPVTNVGACAGAEVVQCYLRDELSSVVQPLQRLVTFQRIHLESGQRAVISFTLGAAELGLWNRELRQVVEPGWFTVRVGASSADIRGEERFEVAEVR